MKDACIWLTAGLELVAQIRYAWLLRRGRAEPTPAMWLLFMTGITLSLFTYLSAQELDWRSGILNAIDVVGCAAALVVSLAAGGSGPRFDKFEKRYLAAAGIIVAYWAASRDALTANLCAQGLIAAGYAPTVRKMVRLKRNTEPFASWIIMLLAALAALYPALSGGKSLAAVYVIRTIAMISAMLALMAFYERRSRRLQAA